MYIMHRKWASTVTIFGKTVITQPNPTTLAVALLILPDEAHLCHPLVMHGVFSVFIPESVEFSN